MALALALPVLKHPPLSLETLRLVLVYGCALALIGAGPFFPGVVWPGVVWPGVAW